MAVADLIKSVLKELESVMKTRTAVGDPMKVGQFTIIPVSKISFGFGGGGGADRKEKGGSGEAVGGGWSIEPLAFIVIGKEGANLYTIKAEESIAGKLMEVAPKVARTVKDFMEKKGKSETEEEEEAGANE